MSLDRSRDAHYGRRQYLMGMHQAFVVSEEPADLGQKRLAMPT